jgi:hypothetical protein
MGAWTWHRSAANGTQPTEFRGAMRPLQDLPHPGPEGHDVAAVVQHPCSSRRHTGMTVTLSAKSPVDQSPKLPPAQVPVKVDDVDQITQVGQAPTAGTPVQGSGTETSKPSWLSQHIKLVGALAGGAVLGTIGFLTLGPLGGIGGAAVGALAGALIAGKLHPGTSSGSGTTQTTQEQPPLPK